MSKPSPLAMVLRQVERALRVAAIRNPTLLPLAEHAAGRALRMEERMRIYFDELPGRGDVPHVVTEAKQVTYPNVIAEAHGTEARAKYVGMCGYTSIRGREATPAEVRQWQTEPKA